MIRREIDEDLNNFMDELKFTTKKTTKIRLTDKQVSNIIAKKLQGFRVTIENKKGCRSVRIQ